MEKGPRSSHQLLCEMFAKLEWERAVEDAMFDYVELAHRGSPRAADAYERWQRLLAEAVDKNAAPATCRDEKR